MGMNQSSHNDQNKDLQVVTVDSNGRSLSASSGVDSGHNGKIKGITRLLTVENQKRQQKQDDSQLNKENLNILKHIFKKMDPSILKSSAISDHGDINLSLKYEASRELLLIKVVCCRDLDPKDLRGQSADPYVKLILRTDSESFHVRRTQTIKNTLNPTFNELFTYDLSQELLMDCQLIVQVWDYDMLEKDDFIGEIIVPLSGLDLLHQNIHTGWYTLKSETNLTITGDLEITLSYQLPETLYVTVHGGSNLTNVYEKGNPNPIVKVQIPGIQTLYETKVQYNTVNPIWEETFEFEVPVEEFASRYIVLHAIDFDGGNDNESLGQIIIELANLDIEKGYHGSFKLADMRNNDRLRAKWFQDATLQEFREALVAHAAFRQPKFLFQKHSGSKLIKVVNKKAKSEAKLRIVNGIPVY